MKAIEKNGCKNLIGRFVFCLLLAVLSAAFVYAENASAAVVDSGTCGENLTWTLDDAGALTISGSGEMKNYTYSSHAPWYSHCLEIKSVVIENGVTSIGNYAFDGCSSITEVHYNGNSKEFAKISIGERNGWLTNNTLIYCIDKTIKKYGICGNDLFWILDDVGAFTISGSGKMDNYQYFYDVPWDSYTSEIKSVVIENGVTSIGNYAFDGCDNLSEVHYNGNFKEFVKISIGERNDRLTNNTLIYCADKTIKEYGICGDNLIWSFDDTGTLTISGSGEMKNYSLSLYAPWYNRRSEIKNAVIENGVTSIGDSAFRSCSSLTSVTIPGSVTIIGDYAFRGCDNLTEVHYNSTLADFLKITVGAYNTLFINAKLYYADIVAIGYGTCGDNLIWVLDDAGTLTISGSGDMWNYTSSSVPWYNRLSETKNVVIENGVTSISDGAFSGCSSLTSVTIPASITVIGDYAFSGCSSLTSITLPDSVTSIGGSAFSGCSGLTSVTIPASITVIGDYAFFGCTGLTSVTIPDSVTSIGDSAFSGCSSLTSVTIPDSVTSIGNYAFCDCAGLTSIDIPDGVPSVGDRTFWGCSSLTSVTIPNSVTSIGDYAFLDCDNLTEVHYSGNFKEFVKISIGVENGRLTNNTLIYCADKTIKKYGTCGNNLTWTLDDAGTLTVSGSGEITSGAWDYYKSEIKNVVIENGVTSIDNSAFRSCTSLTSVTIPDSVTSIGGSAFSGCSSLTSVTIPDSVTSIGQSAFYGCSNLTSVTIPDSVTVISDYVFRGCTSLTSIIIPNGVTSIGESAFFYCNGLTSVTIPDSVKSIGNSAFSGCDNLTEVHYNSNLADFLKITVGAYNTPFINAKLYCTDIVAIGCGICGDNLIWVLDDAGTLTISGSGEMTSSAWDYYKSEIKNVVIENGVTSIDSSAFSGCTGLTSITMPNSVTSISSQAFRGCTSLTTITIPSSVTSIGYSAFSDCTDLTSVTIPDSVTSIADSMFSGCTGLTSITIPSSVTCIADWAFYNCYNLTEVHYNSTLADFSKITVGEHNTSFIDAKIYCTDIVAIGYGTCGDNLTWTLNDAGTLTISGTGVMNNYQYSQYVPWNSHRLEIKNIIIENTVTNISSRAFDGCINVTSVTIPDSVTSIGMFAFSSCGLTSITIPNGVTGIGWGAFQYCDSLTSITISASVTRIDTSAFGGCSNLKEVYYGGSEKLWQQITIASGNDELTNAKKYYNEASLPPDADGICGNNLTWTLNDAGTLTISGSGAMNDYTNSSAPWYNRLPEIKNVVIEDGVTSIGNRAFQNCANLTNVIIPDSVTSIGDWAFAYYNQLTSITIPDSVTSIGIQAFDFSIILKEINVDENNLHYASDNGVLLNRNKTEILFSPRGKTGNYTIPDGVTNIADWAFSRCGLTNVVIPISMIDIGEYAFAYCDRLTSVTIPGSVTSIGEDAFYGCENLAEIVVDKNNQNYITENNVLFNKDKTNLILAAKGVSGTYTIPNSVTSVGFTAFKLCVDLTEVYYNGKFADLAQIIPDGHWCFSVATTIYCTDLAVRDYHIFEDGFYGAGSYYLDTNGTIFFIGNGEMGDCISAAPYWYDYKSEIKNAVINSGITYIGHSNFTDLSSLTSVTIPDSVTRISGWAFNGCDGLKDVYYSGTRKGWNAIDIGSNNDYLTNATIHCSDGTIISTPTPTPTPMPTITAKITRTDTAADTEYKFTVTPDETLDTAYASCKVYAVVYDKSDRLLGDSCVGLKTDGSTEISVNKSDTDASAKIFIWSDTMQPVLRNTEKIPLQ